MNGLLDDVPTEKLGDLEPAFHEYMAASHRPILDEIKRTGDFTEETDAALRQAILDFKATVAY